MTRKGEIGRHQIKRQWPYQVALPALTMGNATASAPLPRCAPYLVPRVQTRRPGPAAGDGPVAGPGAMPLRDSLVRVRPR
jgi:hypothetical protein